MVRPEEDQDQEDSQDEDDEYQKKCAAVILPDLPSPRPSVLSRLGGLTVCLSGCPVVLESVVSHALSLLGPPVIILRLLSLLLLLLLLLSPDFTQLSFN